MGWLDKVKGAAKEAGRAAKEKAEEAASQADQKFQDDDWYQDAKQGAEDLSDKVSDEVESARQSAVSAVEDFGDTEVGEQIGDKSRQISKYLSELPVFSLTSDVIRERNGIPSLIEHLEADTSDPERYLWLAEAMRRARTEQAVYKKLRSVADPSFFFVGEAVKTVNSLGKVSEEPTERKLLKKAFAIGRVRARKNPEDATALQVLSRVYYLQDRPGEAAKHAKIAHVAKPEDLRALHTLSRLYMDLDQLENARRSAMKVIEGGNSIGNAILADLALLSDRAHEECLKRYEVLRERISRADREGYYGPSADALSVIEGVGRSQWTKLIDAVQ